MKPFKDDFNAKIGSASVKCFEEVYLHFSADQDGSKLSINCHCSCSAVFKYSDSCLSVAQGDYYLTFILAGVSF